jgi:hypothetical protein
VDSSQEYKLHSTKYWGLRESAWIIRHFRNEGHSVPDSVCQVIRLGHATSHEGQNKGTYPNLRDFRELREDCMLIHHGEMVAILLHRFVPSTKASEHLQTLGYLFRYGGTISRSCSRESRMALFGHKFCRFNLTVDRSAPFHCPNSVYACYNLNNLFSHDAWFSFLQVPTPLQKMLKTRKLGRKKNWSAPQMLGPLSSWRRICVPS